MIERIEKRRKIFFVTKFQSTDKRETTMLKLISSPHLKNINLIDSNIISVELRQTHVTYDKMWLTAFCILENSKLLMNQYIHNILYKIFSNDFEFLSTDTDSIIGIIKNLSHEEISEKIRNNIQYFDGASFESDKIPKINFKVSGVLSNECGNKFCLNFIYLRSKCYYISLLNANGSEYTGKIRAKSIPRKISRNFTLENYQKVLEAHETHSIKFNKFHLNNLNIYTIEQRRVGLTPPNEDEEKRFFLNSSNSYAFGHYRIKNIDPPFTYNNEKNHEKFINKMNKFKKLYKY